MAAYALAIFSGAFLLFLVQPLIAKYILPWFGGTPGVWTVCMLFFQLLLLFGYAYAHLVTRLLAPRAQALLHLALLVLAVIALPIAPADSWKPGLGDDPTLRILLLLTVSIGPSYFVLSTTGPLLQRWLSASSGDAPPYRLYALSNVGSLLALLGYPFVIEPLLSRRAQAEIWSVGMIVFACICGALAVRLFRGSAGASRATGELLEDAPRPPLRDCVLWLALPTVGSVMLLATTNKLCEELAAIPFLWVLPLSLYLLSFVICFDNPRWYSRTGFGIALLVCMAGYGTLSAEATSIFWAVGAHAVFLFVVCMLCHGELYARRPHPSHLTAFYLAVAAGGALGGVLVALIAPLVFVHYEEFELAILLCGAMVLVIHVLDESSPLQAEGSRLGWALLIVAYLGLGWGLVDSVVGKHRQFVYATRDFHGALYIDHPDWIKPASLANVLWSGNTRHGIQVNTPELRRQPTSYFGEETGIGRALLAARERGNLRIGVVGLGIGTLAAYGRSGDELLFYEINPKVAELASEYFTYLSDSEAPFRVVLGDARLSLEREPPQEFDVLILDAFTSDAPPVHLLTRQAFEIYLKHLKPDGVLAVNISNRHIDLRPVVMALGEHFDLTTLHVLNQPTAERWWVFAASWILMTRDPAFIASEPIAEAAQRLDGDSIAPILWTDERTSLLQVLQ